jgi:DNA-directed RNA polymerase beta' subunit
MPDPHQKRVMLDAQRHRFRHQACGKRINYRSTSQVRGDPSIRTIGADVPKKRTAFNEQEPQVMTTGAFFVDGPFARLEESGD